MSRFPHTALPATSDVIFQYIFSSENSEECLLHFINAIQLSAGRTLAKEVKIRNPFNVVNFLDIKKTILDVKVSDEKNRMYDIEIQTYNEPAFSERILYYWSQLYSMQLPPGAGYSRLNPAVSIVLTRFNLFHELSDFHNVFNITAEKEPAFRLTNHFEMHVVELLKAEGKSWNDISNQRFLLNWTDFLLNSNTKTEAEMNELAAETPGLGLAYDKYCNAQMDENLRDAALAYEKFLHDQASQFSHRLDEAKAEGVKLGIEQGIEQGIERGIETERVKTALKLFRRFYSDYAGDEIQNQILQLRDLEKLERFIDASCDQKPIEEILKLL